MNIETIKVNNLFSGAQKHYFHDKKILLNRKYSESKAQPKTAKQDS